MELKPELPQYIDSLKIEKPEDYLLSLERCLNYDLDTGLFSWRIRFRRGGRGGRGRFKPAGRVTTKGYIQLSFEGNLAQAHQAAWFLVFGWWPRMVAHVNDIKDDNRIRNLRACTPLQNSRAYYHPEKSLWI